MTITQLEYVVAVATYKSFVAAAEKCFVTQPTLSMQIQKLEEELGVKLFDRNKHPIAVTVMGDAIVEQARIIIAECNKVTELIQVQQNILGGTLRFAVFIDDNCFFSWLCESGWYGYEYFDNEDVALLENGPLTWSAVITRSSSYSYEFAVIETYTYTPPSPSIQVSVAVDVDDVVTGQQGGDAAEGDDGALAACGSAFEAFIVEFGSALIVLVLQSAGGFPGFLFLRRYLGWISPVFIQKPSRCAVGHQSLQSNPYDK
jgi:hypothetical protein